MKLFLFSAGLFLLTTRLHAQNDTAKKDLAAPGHYFKSFDGRAIYYEVKGRGKPVILIHGFIVDGESWKKTAVYKDLLESGYKVITLDLRGNGRSDKPHDPAA